MLQALEVEVQGKLVLPEQVIPAHIQEVKLV